MAEKTQTKPQTKPKVNKSNVGVTIVIGGHYWGKGKSLAEAKANFRKQGGLLKRGYSTLEFGERVEFTGVDQMGYVSWRHIDGERADEHPPKVTDHAPKG